jgi:serine/threonine protein kinase/Flp pilus assembly protein TadD
MATQPGAQGEFHRPQDQQSTQPPAESQKLPGGHPPNEQSAGSRQAATPAEKEHTLTSLEEDSLQPPVTGPGSPLVVRPPEEVIESAQYRIVKKIGEGGMGVVYLADDLVLHRKVAIKFAQTPARQARLQREAEITALLEHPGVVPVLMRGQQDGRLYYVMRYVEGERFDQAIHAWHKSCQSARDFRQTKVQLQFRELLQRFVAVCQTVAYAHSRGIIHRDLKPSNILLGRFGETIVLDWGLARRKSVDGDAGSPDSAKAPDEADYEYTRTGVRLGTAVYMAPEQVDGKPADERTDVFLLGATLYHLLTGQPPFCLGRPAKPPRQLKPWIPAALQAICCKAMADDAQARYATAEQLAADVKRWLADEPVAVYREPLGQRLARWLRRHRTLAGVAGVVVLVVVPLTIGFSLLVAAKNQELSQTNRDLESALAREEDQRRQAEQARQLAEQRRAEAEEAQELADLRRQQAERAAERARSVIELVASDEAFDQLSRKKELTAEEKKLLEALVPYYEEYARESHKTPQAVVSFGGMFFGGSPLLPFGFGLGSPIPDPGQYRPESNLGKQEQERQAWAYFRLGRTLHLLGRHEPAEKAYRQALQLCEQLVAEHPQVPEYRQDLATTHNNLGVLLKDTGRPAEAEKAYRQALQLRERLVAEHPQVPEYRQGLAGTHTNLGVLLEASGRLADAEKAYRQALQLYQRLVAEHPQVPQYRQELASTHNNLGALLETTGRAAEAEKAFRQVLQLRERLVAEHPQVPEHRRELAMTHNNLGNLLQITGRADEAEKAYRRAVQLYERLVAEHPQVPQCCQELARTYTSLGVLLETTGRLAEAEKAYRQALQLQERLLAEHPQVVEYKIDLGRTLGAFGLLCATQGKSEEGRQYFERARKVLREVVEKHPDLAEARQLLKAVEEDYAKLGGK